MNFEQLAAFISVVEEGGFQAAARKLHISQPSVSAAVRKLESTFGFTLFSRDSYRAQLTAVGREFYKQAKNTILGVAELEAQGRILAQGNEPEISIAIDEAVPFDLMLRIMKSFFKDYPNTRLKIFREGVRGAHERIQLGTADLAIAPDRQTNPKLEAIPLGTVSLIPVCAANYPAAEFGTRATLRDLATYVQLIIRDTSTIYDPADFGVVAGAATSCTVSDYGTKKKIILAELGWGRLPHYDIQNELRDGSLVSLANDEIDIPLLPVCAVRYKKPAGPIFQRLWSFVSELAAGESLIT